MPRFRTLEDLEDGAIAGKSALVRCDLNLPVQDGVITDMTRVQRLKPTVDTLCRAGARVVLLSHFGRPKGRARAEFSLGPLTEGVSAQLQRPVVFAPDCIGPAAEAAIADAAGQRPAALTLLENLRFHPGEEANDPTFADALAKLGDFYVNDAFSAAHRAHASTAALAERLPALAGCTMVAELDALSRILEAPARPVMAVVGGAKVSGKLALLSRLVEKTDCLIVGGGMANSFLFALGRDVGSSLCEREMAGQVRSILAAADQAGCRILLPRDVTVAREPAPGVAVSHLPVDGVPAEGMILDIGPATMVEFCSALEDCRSLIWNGPLGLFEIPPFDAGTLTFARKAGALTKAGRLVSVAGGGDTLAALARAGVAADFSYVSTAGGAFLEWMEGRTLPGVAALEAAATRMTEAEVNP